MAFDTFMKLGDIKGESVGNRENNPLEKISTATVQLGENNLGQVASRLGFHKDDLLAANPHIKDPSNLKVGQEIQLPPHPPVKDEGSAASTSTDFHANELPKAPVGDPLEAGLIKHSLDMQATHARLYADNAGLDSKMKEADQRYQNAMASATTGPVLGSIGGGAPASSVAAFMIQYQKLLNKEFREDQREQRDAKAVQQEAKAAGNTSLSNVETPIKEVLNEIENMRSSEDQIKDAAKNREEIMDSVDSQLQKAAQSYEQAMGAVTGNSAGTDTQGTTTANGESELKARDQAVFPDRH